MLFLFLVRYNYKNTRIIRKTDTAPEKFSQMNVEERIKALDQLGSFLASVPQDEFQSVAEKAALENPWFTKDNVRMAIDGVGQFLRANTLAHWISSSSTIEHPRTIALITAGNIPLVGFHDLLSVLVTGHTAMLKLSGKDNTLMKWVIEKLTQLEPRFAGRITVSERLKGFDAVIATGSDNSSRYFDYYFGKYPNIIRRNRTAVAVLSGRESDSQLQALGTDIFSYFGLGCRNVSKLFVPQDYSFDRLFQNMEVYQPIIHHNKYHNNYDYQRSILLVNRIPFFDNGFVVLQQSQKIVSPISVVYFEYYSTGQHLLQKLDAVKDKIQCIVGDEAPATVPFGKAQFPAIDDYADGIDTLKFLTSLDT